MVGLGPNQAESMGSQCEDHFVNLERKRDREVIMHTTHTSRSQSWNASHLSYGEDTRALQLEINHLKRSLRHEWWKRLPSNSDFSSNNEEDGSYRHRSRTPSSESLRGLGNDAMSKAFNQIFRSPFACRIEGRTLPRQLSQPTFTIYSGRTNPVEHVCHFN